MKGGKIAHYSSLPIFKDTIFKLGEIVVKLNEILRYTAFDKLESRNMFQQMLRRQIIESMVKLYGIEGEDE